MTRSAHDHYVTPPEVADVGARLALDGRRGRVVLDPCAGTGALLDAVRRQDSTAVVGGFELDPARAAAAALACGNALEIDWPAAHAVLMNPPFSAWEAFVRKAVDLRYSRVVVLLRLGALAGVGRFPFWAGIAATHGVGVTVLSRRPSFTGGGTDSQDYGWITLTRGAREASWIRWSLA